MPKKLAATLYMESGIFKQGFGALNDPQGYLFSGGRYKTKILPEELPEWYVYGYIYKQHGFVSAKGVKHLFYMPNYVFDNHLHKDDSLFISYNEIIKPFKTDTGLSWYIGYDHVISGLLIEKFVIATEKYSNYDVSEIQKEIAQKRQWYYERHPDERSKQI